MSKLKKYSLILMAIVMVAVSVLTVYAANPTSGSLTIILHEQKNGDITTNPVMEGIEYTLYKVDEECDYLWEAELYVERNSVSGIKKISGADGKIMYTGLELGRYYAALTNVPDGTISSPEGFLVDIPTTNANGIGFNYDIVVEPKMATAFGNIEFKKVDSEGNPIEGAIFKVQVKKVALPVSLDDATDDWSDYIPEGENTVLTVTTNSEGKITLNNLPQAYEPVEYRLIEISAPEEYIINNNILSNVDFYVTNTGKISVNTNNLNSAQKKLIEVEETENLTKVIYTNEKPEIVKKVKNSTDVFVDNAGVNIPGVVTFRISVTVPLSIADMSTYRIVDQLPEGFIFDESSLTIESDFGVNYCNGTDTEFEIIFDTSEMAQSNGEPWSSEVVITYDAYAIDIDSVTIGGDGNINMASLIYTNNIGERYYDSENNTWVDSPEISTHTITDTAEVHTGALKIEKVEKGSTATKLAGAKFKIATTKANAENGTFVKDVYGNDIEVETDTNGLAEIKGLAYADDGSDTSYWLVETKAPTYEETVDGQAVTKSYNLLKNPVEVKIGKTTYDTAVTIQNSKGLDLPATGGIGVAIFAVVGMTMMIISAKINKRDIVK